MHNFKVKNTKWTNAHGTKMEKLGLLCPNEGLKEAVMQHIIVVWLEVPVSS